MRRSVRAGSASHREAMAPGGHKRSQPACGNPRPQRIHRSASNGGTGWDGLESHLTTAAPPVAACPRGKWSPRTGLTCARAGASAAASELRCPRRPCPQRALSSSPQRSPRVNTGSTGKVADLRHRRTANSTTVLPKLTVMDVEVTPQATQNGRGQVASARVELPWSPPR